MVGQTKKPVAPGAAPSPALKEAVRLHQAGDLGRAEALYREAIAAAPGYALSATNDQRAGFPIAKTAR